ncbi:hypothetical protein BKA62DRAFT_742360 [Auriculariales sp. MPI-PUGE-AT-0066]|nr:hypothetical protein BKA62DRAFT_742360 [Auriculariales sp. MPI-PUGE-AT-0066]
MSSPSSITSTTTRVGRVAGELSRLRLHSGSPALPREPAINTMPSELLSEVFLYASSRATVFKPPGALAFEMRLTHVCTHWRTIACGTPHLWSHIDVNLHGCDSESSLLKIDVDLNVSDDEPPLQLRYTNLVGPAMKALIARVDHWHDVGFQLGHPRQLADIEHFLGCTFTAPHLARLDIVLEYDELERMPPPWRLACTTPKLRTMMLDGVPLEWGTAVASFCSQLEEVNITFAEGSAPTLAQFRTLLRRSRDLRTMHLISYDPPPALDDAEIGDQLDPADAVALSQLTDLVLGDIAPEVLRAMLDPVHFPALQQLNLTLESPDPTGVSYNAAVRLLATRRLPQLQHLSLTGIDCGVVELRALLINLPALSTLYMVLDEHHDGMCEALAPGGTGAARVVPAPKLESVTLRTARAPRVWDPFTVLRRALQAREGLGARLGRLVLDLLAERVVAGIGLSTWVDRIEFRNLEQRRLFTASDRSQTASVTSESDLTSASASEVDE